MVRNNTYGLTVEQDTNNMVKKSSISKIRRNNELLTKQGSNAIHNNSKNNNPIIENIRNNYTFSKDGQLQ